MGEDYVYIVYRYTDCIRQSDNEGEIIAVCKTKDTALMMMEKSIQSFISDIKCAIQRCDNEVLVYWGEGNYDDDPEAYDYYVGNINIFITKKEAVLN